MCVGIGVGDLIAAQRREAKLLRRPPLGPNEHCYACGLNHPFGTSRADAAYAQPLVGNTTTATTNGTNGAFCPPARPARSVQEIAAGAMAKAEGVGSSSSSSQGGKQSAKLAGIKFPEGGTFRVAKAGGKFKTRQGSDPSQYLHEERLGVNKAFNELEFAMMMRPIWKEVAFNHRQTGSGAAAKAGCSRLWWHVLGETKLCGKTCGKKGRFQTQVCKDIFRQIDLNQNGVITLDELRRFILYFDEEGGFDGDRLNSAGAVSARPFSRLHFRKVILTCEMTGISPMSCD